MRFDIGEIGSDVGGEEVQPMAHRRVAAEGRAVEVSVLASPVGIDVALLHDYRPHTMGFGNCDEPLQRSVARLGRVVVANQVPAAGGDVDNPPWVVVRAPLLERQRHGLALLDWESRFSGCERTHPHSRQFVRTSRCPGSVHPTR